MQLNKCQYSLNFHRKGKTPRKRTKTGGNSQQDPVEVGTSCIIFGEEYPLLACLYECTYTGRAIALPVIDGMGVGSGGGIRKILKVFR